MNGIAVTEWTGATPGKNRNEKVRVKSSLWFKGFFFAMVILPVWLGLGVFIAWLLADFNRAMAQQPAALLSPWSVFCLFFLCAIVMGWFRMGKSPKNVVI